MLPAMNGFEVGRAIPDQGLEMPILMLTAKGQEQGIVLGLNVGADDYVTKLFRIRELIARAHAFLRRRTPPSSLCRFGDCEVDLAARVVRRGGRTLSLTAKEFKLLEFFIARSGRALSRDVILDAVWGQSVFVTARSIDRRVTTLRAKIEPHTHCPIYIHTLRDVGYRFEPARSDGK